MAKDESEELDTQKFSEDQREVQKRTRAKHARARQSSTGRQISLRWAIVALAAVVIIAAAVVYVVMANAGAANSNPDAALVAKLERVMILPQDEQPVISTVTDAAGLKTNAPFYRDAENGDKILIYAQAGKIIIYRESANLIINAGPILEG
jgi:anti-sigma-K factor RskA